MNNLTLNRFSLLLISIIAQPLAAKAHTIEVLYPGEGRIVQKFEGDNFRGGAGGTTGGISYSCNWKALGYVKINNKSYLRLKFRFFKDNSHMDEFLVNFNGARFIIESNSMKVTFTGKEE